MPTVAAGGVERNSSERLISCAKVRGEIATVATHVFHRTRGDSPSGLSSQHSSRRRRRPVPWINCFSPDQKQILGVWDMEFAPGTGSGWLSR